jgi:hypothetical protein
MIGLKSSMESDDAFAAEIEESLHLKEQEAIIAQCEGQCKKILDLVDSNVLAVETVEFQTTLFASFDCSYFYYYHMNSSNCLCFFSLQL